MSREKQRKDALLEYFNSKDERERLSSEIANIIKRRASDHIVSVEYQMAIDDMIEAVCGDLNNRLDVMAFFRKMEDKLSGIVVGRELRVWDERKISSCDVMVA